MKTPTRRVFTLATLLLTLPFGCGLLPLSGEKPQPTEATPPVCQLEQPDQRFPLPLDNRWITGSVDCAAGQSTIRYQPGSDRSQLAIFYVEALGSGGPITVFRQDGQGEPSWISESSDAQTGFAIRVDSESSLLVFSPGQLEFRIRGRAMGSSAPTAKETVQKRPVQRQVVKAQVVEAPVVEAPVVKAKVVQAEVPEAASAEESETAIEAPAQPRERPRVVPRGFQLANVIGREGAPVRSVQIDKGTERGVLVGQLGRLMLDGRERSSFCVKEADADGATAKLASPVSNADFGEASDKTVVVSTSVRREADLRSVIGTPVAQIELRQGSSECLYVGQRGALEKYGQPIATFRIERVVPSRAWATLDQPIEEDEANVAVVVLYFHD